MPQLIFLCSNKPRFASAPLSFSYFYFRAPEQKQTRRETNTAAYSANNAGALSAAENRWLEWLAAETRSSVLRFLMRKRSRITAGLRCWSAWNQERRPSSLDAVSSQSLVWSHSRRLATQLVRRELCCVGYMNMRLIMESCACCLT